MDSGHISSDSKAEIYSEFQLPSAKRQKLGESATSSDMQPEVSTKSVGLEPIVQNISGIATSAATPSNGLSERRPGEAPIKAEFRINKTSARPPYRDDDEAEAAQDGQIEAVPESSGRGHRDSGHGDRGGRGARGSNRGGRGNNNNKKDRGQNKNRKFGSWGDKLPLCNSRALSSEFSPEPCKFGDLCTMEHDLRKYLAQGKMEDLQTFDGKCPSYEEYGTCPMGWKCRFVGSHSKEVLHEDSRRELVLSYIASTAEKGNNPVQSLDNNVVNVITMNDKIDLNRRRVALPKSDVYLQWLDKIWNVEVEKRNNKQIAMLPDAERAVAQGWGKLVNKVDSSPSEPGLKAIDSLNDKEIKDTTTTESFVTQNAPKQRAKADELGAEQDLTSAEDIDMKDEAREDTAKAEKEDHRSAYCDPPLRVSEKRRLYYGPETPILAPLTTQGNLPFRRLCISLGAQVTFSEMAVGMPIIEGQKSEWALVKAHKDEITPPTVSAEASNIVQGYDNSTDSKFGVQISAAKPWVAIKSTEILTKFCPSIRAIDLNCGCPIDMIYKSGAGSALLDASSKLEKMLRGMNLVSGDVPITAKIRTGTRDNHPTAHRLVERLVLGSKDAQEIGHGPCGVAAITLHGRSRQQRYSRLADWGYIAEVAAIIKDLRTEAAAREDTIREPDARDLPNGGRILFVGNGDCYSHIDYNTHIESAGVDSVMIGRGALVKPWLFEEIATNQYLDKSASERLEYIKQFVRYGLDCWGSDEMGVGTTRRFLLEWLSFTCRYVPIGILEHLPPRLNERPPAYQGRNELETLLASSDCRDWIKISEMFLGKAHEGFRFTPKHKSNSYETEG